MRALVPSQLDAALESLALRNKELTELKELYEVSQESGQRLQKHLRSAKEREEELLQRLQQMDLNMEQVRKDWAGLLRLLLKPSACNARLCCCFTDCSCYFSSVARKLN
jgi:hypothetical protein